MKSMKMAVVCANGKAGRLIVEKAVERGIEVTAVVREENRSSAQNVIKKDLFSLVPEDLAGFDAVIDAFGAWTPETLPQHSSSLKHLCDLLSGTGTRQPLRHPRSYGASHGWPRLSRGLRTSGRQHEAGPR